MNSEFNSCIVLKFPEGSTLKPLDGNRLEVCFKGDPFAEIFTQGFIHDLEVEIGRAPAQAWIEETVERLAKELLLKQIR